MIWYLMKLCFYVNALTSTADVDVQMAIDDGAPL